MKKKLEADLMSIAHRVLQMKNKSDIDQLFIETQKLYEKLAVLRFVDEHYGVAKPTIGKASIESEIAELFEKDTTLTDSLETKEQEEVLVEAILEETPIETPATEIEAEKESEETVLEIEETTTTAVVEEEEIEDVAVAETETETVFEAIVEKIAEPISEKPFIPAFELDIEEAPKKTEAQISLMDILGGDYSEPHFVKADRSEKAPSKIDFDLPKETILKTEKEAAIAEIELSPRNTESKSVSLNDKLAKGITIELNDRIAFVKHLFGNSNEDYNRVLNQLITYDNFEEAQSFIEEMVKPDYNNWEGKEDYAHRFIQIIARKFD